MRWVREEKREYSPSFPPASAISNLSISAISNPSASAHSNRWHNKRYPTRKQINLHRRHPRRLPIHLHRHRRRRFDPYPPALHVHHPLLPHVLPRGRAQHQLDQIHRRCTRHHAHIQQLIIRPRIRQNRKPRPILTNIPHQRQRPRFLEHLLPIHDH